MPQSIYPNAGHNQFFPSTGNILIVDTLNPGGATIGESVGRRKAYLGSRALRREVTRR